MKPLEDTAILEKTLGYTFRDGDLLLNALTHPSLLKKFAQGTQISTYERLEFLGDRVLGLVIAHRLYAAFPKDNEGILAKKFASLVRQEMLSAIAKKINLKDHIRKEDLDLSDSTLSDACEALLGALYLDGGLTESFRVVDRLWGTDWENRDFTQIQDPKSRLQEWTQKNTGKTPIYSLLSKGGTDHDPTFTVSVTVEGKTAQATGNTKKIAQQQAAETLLKDLMP